MQQTTQMIKESVPLWRTRIFDAKKNVGLEVYTDLAVYDAKNHLIAIRFGGYSKMTAAVADALCAGCGLSIETGTGEIRLSSMDRSNYSRYTSASEPYSDILLCLNDDGLTIVKQEEKTTAPKRKLYLFCGSDTEECLYRQLDRKLSVPMLPEYGPYLIAGLRKYRLLERLSVLSRNGSYAAWQLTVSNEETEVAAILTNGLKSGELRIPGAAAGTAFPELKGFNDYMKSFGELIAKRILSIFPPVFDPSKDCISNELGEISDYVHNRTGYSLYDAQLTAAQALKLSLEKDGFALLVGECGAGKSKVGSAALWACQKPGGFHVVLSPAHACPKWVREIEETIPHAIAGIARTPKELEQLRRNVQENQPSVYCIVSRESARDGYMKRPAVIWSRTKRAFLCPHCGKVQEMALSMEGAYMTVPATPVFYRHENNRNRKCKNCGENLWTAVNPSDTSLRHNQWIKISGYGFVWRKAVHQYLTDGQPEELREKLMEILRNPAQFFPTKGACRKHPLSDYLKRKVRHIDSVNVDELHDYSGDSGQGEAMAKIVSIADKVIGMTGSLINGYALGIFYLLFRMKARLMKQDGLDFRKSTEFCRRYGVVQKTWYVEDSVYNEKSRGHRSRVREKFLPGVSALVYVKFLMENTVFLNLEDMRKKLPDFRQIPVALDMPPDVRDEYRRCEKVLRKYLTDSDQKHGNQVLSRYLHFLLSYPDQPYGHPPIPEPDSKKPLVIPADLCDKERLLPKDEWVLQTVLSCVQEGRRAVDPYERENPGRPHCISG